MDETTHQPSSGVNELAPSRAGQSDPSEVGCGCRGWDVDKGGGVSGRAQ
jgi:hypothetical protein